MVAHIPGSCFLDASPSAAKDADWIDSRVRTISRGYVRNTDVIPAAPPHIKRLKEPRSAPGEGSKNYMAHQLCSLLVTLSNDTLRTYDQARNERPQLTLL